MRFTFSSSNTLMHCCMQHTASSSNSTWYVHKRRRTCIPTAVHIYSPRPRERQLHTRTVVRTSYLVVSKYLRAESIIQQEQQHTSVITTCVPTTYGSKQLQHCCLPLQLYQRNVYMYMRIHDTNFNIQTYDTSCR